MGDTISLVIEFKPFNRCGSKLWSMGFKEPHPDRRGREFSADIEPGGVECRTFRVIGRREK